MLQSPDFKELLSAMERHDVRYLVIGGYAVMFYSEPRFTTDPDLWVAADAANGKAIYAALKAFGAPLTGLTPADFAAPGHYYQMGRPPLRVDVMMSIPGGDFEACWGRRNEVTLGDQTVYFTARDDLLAVKRAAGREQDLRDVFALEAAREAQS